jgi:hypothetical protein
MELADCPPVQNKNRSEEPTNLCRKKLRRGLSGLPTRTVRPSTESTEQRSDQRAVQENKARTVRNLRCGLSALRIKSPAPRKLLLSPDARMVRGCLADGPPSASDSEQKLNQDLPKLTNPNFEQMNSKNCETLGTVPPCHHEHIPKRSNPKDQRKVTKSTSFGVKRGFSPKAGF